MMKMMQEPRDTCSVYRRAIAKAATTKTTATFATEPELTEVGVEETEAVEGEFEEEMVDVEEELAEVVEEELAEDAEEKLTEVVEEELVEVVEEELVEVVEDV